MPLDLTAYSRAVHIGAKPPEPGDGDYWDRYLRAYITDARFHRSARGLVYGLWDVHTLSLTPPDCWYDVAGARRRDWGTSYGHHDKFRDDLALLVAGVRVPAVWADPEGFADMAFFEIVQFSDNEGAIGPHAAADLAGDFQQWRERFAAASPQWAGYYDDWAAGCELAADGGLIAFH